MEKLNLAGNKFGDSGAIALSEALDKVAKINLCDCKITSEGIERIADELKKCPDKVKRKMSLCKLNSFMYFRISTYLVVKFLAFTATAIAFERKVSKQKLSRQKCCEKVAMIIILFRAFSTEDDGFLLTITLAQIFEDDHIVKN